MWQGFSGIFKRKRECEDREQTRAVYRKLRRVVRACRGYTVYSSDFRWNVRAVEREWYPGDGILLQGWYPFRLRKDMLKVSYC